MISQSTEIVLVGATICRGIAIGRPFFLNLAEEVVPEYSIASDSIESEIDRYRHAVHLGCEDIKCLQINLQAECVFEGAAILEAHLEIMQDPMLTTNVEGQIRNIGKNADHIFHSEITKFQKKFDSMTDPFFRERFKDIQDISKRILGHLRDGSRMAFSDIPQDSIVFASDLTTFDTIVAKHGHAMAFVTKFGGATSHAAIIAKAKGIPYVSNVNFDHAIINKNAWVIVDGRTGEIIINPSAETLSKYEKLRDQLHSHLENLTRKGKLEAETYDGYGIRLSANIERIDELEMLHLYGGCGVGLLRTESPFLAKETFPTEEEQYLIYSHFVSRMNGLPIAIRTFDLGGDKFLRHQQKGQENNPFLGCRAIRFSLREKEVFKEQLRAILRASALGDVSIMFPMISSLAELLEAKAILHEAREELLAKGVAVAHRIPVGCMIEVPSAAITADLLAKECDFLSIGTNDLVQYALAVDRGNHTLADLYRPTNPGILRLIRLIVSEANHHGIPVAVCGEVAADPRFTPLLLGLGVHELSVASRYLPIIKNAIRNLSIIEASKLADQALSLSSAAEIEALLNQEYRKNAPEDCLYNC
jgi:phosphoenolpyruvate-protein phosphotransferase (PTS system enzyme I)